MQLVLAPPENDGQKISYIIEQIAQASSLCNTLKINVLSSVYGIPFSFRIKLVSYRICFLFTPHRFHFTSDCVPVEIKEHTTANKIGSGVQGTAQESFEIQ